MADPSDPAEVALLAANAAFYRAFAARDGAAMDALWAADAPVACIHPGWGPVEGRAAVMQSWRAILADPGSARIACHDARAFVHGGAGFVICFEEIGGHYLIATNLFVARAGAWRMVHHQAGPVERGPRVTH